jgi:hypothetical protein
MNVRATISLELECSPNRWVIEPNAILDTGASLCVFNAAWARANGFALPSISHVLPTATAAGRLTARVYDVDVNVRFRRMPEVPFSLAVVFSDSHPPTTPPLIGLHNLLNYWRVTFDGTPEPVAFMGHMRFETL